MLRNSRATLLRSPQVKLLQLARIDERLAAYLDGIAVADEFGSRLCEQSLDTPDSSRIFVAAVRAIEDGDTPRLDKLAALVEALPETLGGIMAAFDWVSAEALRGITIQLLASDDPRRRNIGLAACAMHGVDPGRLLPESLQHPDPFLRARALGVAAEVGRVDLLPEARLALRDESPLVRYWAAWAACLLGDRERSIEVLAEHAYEENGSFAQRATSLLAQATSFEWMHEFLRSLPGPELRDRTTTRRLISAAGWSGNVGYLPWLIRQMGDEKLTRIAGESFSLITGADLSWLDLERKPPENFESGPNDDPEDEDVAMDEDDGLPWPDVDRVQAWWSANASRFPPSARYFVGAEPTWDHCVHVLREGYQRQRILAAQYRCLLRPGTPLFNTAAPAPRQKALLATMV